MNAGVTIKAIATVLSLVIIFATINAIDDLRILWKNGHKVDIFLFSLFFLLAISGLICAWLPVGG